MFIFAKNSNLFMKLTKKCLVERISFISDKILLNGGKLIYRGSQIDICSSAGQLMVVLLIWSYIKLGCFVSFLSKTFFLLYCLFSSNEINVFFLPFIVSISFIGNYLSLLKNFSLLANLLQSHRQIFFIDLQLFFFYILYS